MVIFHRDHSHPSLHCLYTNLYVKQSQPLFSLGCGGWVFPSTGVVATSVCCDVREYMPLRRRRFVFESIRLRPVALRAYSIAACSWVPTCMPRLHARVQPIWVASLILCDSHFHGSRIMDYPVHRMCIAGMATGKRSKERSSEQCVQHLQSTTSSTVTCRS